MRPFQGEDASLDASAIGREVVVDSDARRVLVTLNIPRDAVPAGEFVGVLEVGNGTVGLGSATVRVEHQEPVAVNDMTGVEQLVWIAVGSLLLAALIWGVPAVVRWRWPNNGAADGLIDYTLPPAIIIGVLALYPVLANLRRDGEVPAPWWPVWLCAFGLFGGFTVAVIKQHSMGGTFAGGLRFAAALLLSFGAGVTVWRAEYLNVEDWAFTLESALALTGVVGAATAASALLLLPPRTDKQQPGADPPRAGQA